MAFEHIALLKNYFIWVKIFLALLWVIKSFYKILEQIDGQLPPYQNDVGLRFYYTVASWKSDFSTKRKTSVPIEGPKIELKI